MSEGSHPLVVELGRDNVERFERGKVADVFEERGIIRVVLAVVVRSGAGHVEVDEFDALAIGGHLDFAFRAGDDAGDGFDVGVERVS